MTISLISEAAAAAHLPSWDAIDTVLLDMDGTLLDLRFDSYFWLELVPERYAARHGLTLEQSRAVLGPMFAGKQGTLDWYCTDFWTRELSLDIAAMKREVREHVRFLPGAEEFLQALREKGVRVALVTNAHRDSLKVKATQTGVLNYFDVVFSSHSFGVPKEHPEFWRQLQAELQFRSRAHAVCRRQSGGADRGPAPRHHAYFRDIAAGLDLGGARNKGVHVGGGGERVARKPPT